ncbi:MAG: hypothetical protein RIF32_05470 [Leptospirales bacterium]
MFLVVASGLAVDLHRSLHGSNSLALNARLGQYCARHGEGLGIAARSGLALGAARSVALCPVCETRFNRTEAFSTPGRATLTTPFLRRPVEPSGRSVAPAHAPVSRPHTRGPPLS